MGTVNFNVRGASSTTNNQVQSSLSCTNVTAAIGGANVPSVEEIRNLITFNFSAQNRAVTINDYEAIIRKMPGQFGAPAKVAITEEDNKIKINILSYDDTGKLKSAVSNTLKNNLANYLSNYRMMNDYIYIQSADVIDLSFDIYLVLEATQNSGVIVTNVVTKISDYMSPAARLMGQNLNVSELKSLVQQETGVVSVVDFKIYNKVGGLYSSSETSQPYNDLATKEIKIINETIFAEPTQIYQVRYPEKDIQIFVQNQSNPNFS